MNWNAIKAGVADLARPFTLYAMAGSGAWATIMTAQHINNGFDGAALVAAIGLTVSALYAGKVIENYQIARSTADVEKERAKANPPPAAALQPAPVADEPGEDPAMYGGPRP